MCISKFLCIFVFLYYPAPVKFSWHWRSFSQLVMSHTHNVSVTAWILILKCKELQIFTYSNYKMDGRELLWWLLGDLKAENPEATCMYWKGLVFWRNYLWLYAIALPWKRSCGRKSHLTHLKKAPRKLYKSPTLNLRLLTIVAAMQPHRQL